MSCPACASVQTSTWTARAWRPCSEARRQSVPRCTGTIRTTETRAVAPSAAIRAGDWKLIRWYEDGANELYSLEDDPGERYDLSALLPEKAGALAEKLDNWLAEVDANMPSRNPAYDAGKPSGRLPPDER